VSNFGTSWYGSPRGGLTGGVTAVAIATDPQTGGDPNGSPVSPAGEPADGGYWIQNGNGTRDHYGDAVCQGTVPGPALAMVRDPAGPGYWIMTPDGGIASFAAPWYGSLAKDHLRQPPAGLAARPATCIRGRPRRPRTCSSNSSPAASGRCDPRSRTPRRRARSRCP